jgi:hypothetical protein
MTQNPIFSSSSFVKFRVNFPWSVSFCFYAHRPLGLGQSIDESGNVWLSVEIILFISLMIIPLYYSYLAIFFLHEIYEVQIEEATSATYIS